MDYNTRERIETFAKDELGLKPLDEKTLRLIDLVDSEITEAGHSYDERIKGAYDEGVHDEWQRMVGILEGVTVLDVVENEIID